MSAAAVTTALLRVAATIDGAQVSCPQIKAPHVRPVCVNILQPVPVGRGASRKRPEGVPTSLCDSARERALSEL